MNIGRYLAIAALAILAACSQPGKTREVTNVSRATLDNGLRVVVVRDPLAPVVTVEENYLAGGDETPAGFPGMAHAQEHMAFRGCANVTGDQIAAINAQLGGFTNADTQQNITQYFNTVPAEYMDLVLRIDSACMQDVQDSQEEWDKERGAIEQEVARDLSNPTYKFVTRLNEDLFAGTPYAHDALGTQKSFDATTAAMLKDFYKKWYAPNNAILVITGNVDPDATIKRVKELYGPIPKRPLAPRPEVKLQPVKAESFTMESDLPYQLAFLSYRTPGSDSPDYAALRVLSDALASERADLYSLVTKGEALATAFELAETYPLASVTFAAAAIPSGADASAITAKLKEVVAGYLAKGLPADLVEAAKRKLVASAEFERNSIPGLAANWSDALAGQGRNSPDENVQAIQKVTTDDVNRVARAYLLTQNAVMAVLAPAPSGNPVASSGFGGAEQLTSPPSKPVKLPDWAEAALKSLSVPKAGVHPADVTLANGIRLIVQTETISPTITVVGDIRREDKLETPPGKDGVADILEQLFSYGTTHLDRLAFQKALDDIGASESAGGGFGVRVLKQYFDRGVQLLADNELNPALPMDAFQVVKQQTGQFADGNLKSPEHRTLLALEAALLPKGDPALRDVTPQTVATVTLDDVKAYYAKAYRPDLTTIVVIGDISIEEAKAGIEKYFAAWKSEGAKPDVTLPAVPPNGPAAVTVPDPGRIQDDVTLAEEVQLNRFNPDYYAMQLGNHVLGGGFYATRLYHDLRQVAGLVYNVDDSLTADKTRAIYSVTYASDPANVSKARAMIQRDLTAMQKEDATPEELQQAKALLLRQIPLSESSYDAIAGALVRRAQIDLPLDEQIRAGQRYFDLTGDQVRAAFAKWIRPGDFVQVVRGPAPH
jgi:zinc protease